MASIFDDLLRIRSLREERSERNLREAQARCLAAEQAVEQASVRLEIFTREMPEKIEAEYLRLQEAARKTKGVPLHRVQAFRAFETYMYAQREGLRLELVEKQKALKEASDAIEQARQALTLAMRARMKIEQLQQQERAQRIKEEERNEEKQLEEFQPRSIFAQLQ